MDSSGVLGKVEMPEGACEVCASAKANYDEEHSRLVVDLASFLRTADLPNKERQLSAPWLPHQETVDLARDIFHSWVRKVRQAMLPRSGQS